MTPNTFRDNGHFRVRYWPPSGSNASAGGRSTSAHHLLKILVALLPGRESQRFDQGAALPEVSRA